MPDLAATPTPTARDWMAALRTTQDQLTRVVTELDDDTLVGPSYDSEWTVAQVLSHLGSGAEIFDLFLDAGLAGRSAPGIEAFHPVWDAWNGRSAVAKRDDAVSVNEKLVAKLEGLSPAEAAAFHLDMFGTETDLAGFLRMRLGEHSVHTWDVAVALDPSALVAAGVVELLIDHLGQIAARSGRASQQPSRVRVTTTDPGRDFFVSVGETVTAEPVAGSETTGTTNTTTATAATTATDWVDGSLTLPAEAYLRLIYGRLDPDHTPELAATGSPANTGARGLDDLRATFQGF